MNLTSKSYGKQYYEEHKASNLDYLVHGEWHSQYANWMVKSLSIPRGARMLDVGCACGALLEGFRNEGIACTGIDLSEHMIDLGREKFQELDLHVMDAINMHLFDDDQFDFVHSAQVAEHWMPQHRSLILREIYRVTKSGGLFFCCMDTEDQMVRQERQWDGPGEDPTHQPMISLQKWMALAKLENWTWEIDRMRQVVDHPDSYFKQYDWDAMLLSKP